MNVIRSCSQYGTAQCVSIKQTPTSVTSSSTRRFITYFLYITSHIIYYFHFPIFFNASYRVSFHVLSGFSEILICLVICHRTRTLIIWIHIINQSIICYAYIYIMYKYMYVCM